MTIQQFVFSPWRKSSHSGSVGQECVEVAGGWHKSSHSSGSEGQCVEVASLADRLIGMRDSKDPEGPVLSIAPVAWESLLTGIRAGAFDRTT